MELDAFCRNLRGVNGGADFPRPLLAAIYDGIKRSPLRTTGADGAGAAAGAAGGAGDASAGAAAGLRAVGPPP